jgi:hypothetical protein
MSDPVIQELTRFPLTVGSGLLYAGSPSRSDSFQHGGTKLVTEDEVFVSVIADAPFLDVPSYRRLVAILVGGKRTLSGLETGLGSLLTSDLVVIEKFPHAYGYIAVGDHEEAKAFNEQQNGRYLPEVMEEKMVLAINSPSPQMVGESGASIMSCVGEDCDFYVLVGKKNSENGYSFVALMPDFVAQDIGYLVMPVEDKKKTAWDFLDDLLKN